MKNLIYLLIILSFIFVSCKNSGDCTDCDVDPEEIGVDSTKVVVEKNDSITSPIEEKQENLEKIVAKFGEQWDFCTCVVANDSINKAFEKDLSDKAADKLMNRWEHVETKCKELLTSPNNTPEERAIHEKKVKKCLKQAKSK